MSTIKQEARTSLASASRTPLQALLYESATSHDIGKLMFFGLRLLREPRGDGHAVIVIPGFGQDDSSTRVLRLFLDRLGYRVYGWGQGQNQGQMGAHKERLLSKALHLQQTTAAQVSLVGWSMGGYLARELASERPDAIRQVITLGAPITGGSRHTAFARYIKRSRAIPGALEQQGNQRLQLHKLDVPVTAIYSRRDGIVAWQACIDQLNPQVEHVEVSCTHLGLGYNPKVYSVIARRLANKQDN